MPTIFQVIVYLIFWIIGIGLGFLICKHIIKIKQQEIDQTIQAENEKLKRENDNLNNSLASLKQDISISQQQFDNIQLNIKNKENEAKEISDNFLEKNMEIAQLNFEHAMEKLGLEYENAEKDYKDEYGILMEELVNEFTEKQATLQEQYQIKVNDMTAAIETYVKKIQEMSITVEAATEALKRTQLEADKVKFYQLQLSDQDIQEIQVLRSIEYKLRDPAPLNKVIWKVYYEKPYTDLIGRVVGTNIKTGIYKITNLENGMTYVGQAVNIADRWKQHIKRGIGADPPTKNKLYPAMKEFGVENFTFEIIEECSREKLNEREDYWQEFFHSKEYGYSIK